MAAHLSHGRYQGPVRYEDHEVAHVQLVGLCAAEEVREHVHGPRIDGHGDDRHAVLVIWVLSILIELPQRCIPHDTSLGDLPRSLPQQGRQSLFDVRHGGEKPADVLVRRVQVLLREGQLAGHHRILVLPHESPDLLEGVAAAPGQGVGLLGNRFPLPLLGLHHPQHVLLPRVPQDEVAAGAQTIRGRQQQTAPRLGGRQHQVHFVAAIKVLLQRRVVRQRFAPQRRRQALEQQGAVGLFAVRLVHAHRVDVGRHKVLRSHARHVVNSVPSRGVKQIPMRRRGLSLSLRLLQRQRHLLVTI
mmetsp:Transcript_16881/g.64288  ORF Transcript_16881/g.64288 Transcript_16881/m.64288 type:complete len:301 (-) Transcript_16881:144-1046(-)